MQNFTEDTGLNTGLSGDIHAGSSTGPGGNHTGPMSNTEAFADDRAMNRTGPIDTTGAGYGSAG